MVKDDCIFCKIMKGEIPSATIYENSDFKVILDVSPANRGHALIITKEHYDNIFQLDAETAGKLFSLATVVARAIKEETQCEGLNVVQNNGEVAGQTVNHFHLHLVPRFKGDNVSVTWKQGESDSNDLAELAKALKKRI
ncbi:MAG: HIT family protein [Lachnospiraceae bacterium]|nr:HIT family protein [Lachnospiraceae bacterium]